MFRRPVLVLAALTPLWTAAPALAQDALPDAREARRQLFRDDRAEVIRLPDTGLSDDEMAVLALVAGEQKYYAAVAISPDEGLMSEATVMAANHHSPEAARAAAESECNTRRAADGAACVVVMEVRPTGWEARDLMLSADATTDFNDSYRRARGSRAFAVSPATGQWGIGAGEAPDEAALAACRGESEVSDCVVVIRD